MQLRMKNLNILGFTENLTFRGEEGLTKNQQRGGLPKKRGLDSSQIQAGVFAKKEGGRVFEGGS